MTTSPTAHPVRTLREHVTALEAAITLCLAGARPRAVHRLRTTTRRIEGQFALLAAMPNLPALDARAIKEARRSLKKIRRAAGAVRDLDVQVELIDDVQASGSTALLHDVSRLQAKIEATREDDTKRLRKLLRGRGVELAGELENLLETFEPVESLSLTPAELIALARDWFQKNTPTEPPGDADDPEYLHAVRKTAKLARYIAENAPKSAASARKLARGFEDLQQAGGEWHDLLVLAEKAREMLGEASPLTEALTQRCQLALKRYKQRLVDGVA